MCRAHIIGLALVLLTTSAVAQNADRNRSNTNGKEEAEVARRVAEWIQVFANPDARGGNLDETVRAIKELATIGEPAVPHLMEAMLSPNVNVSVYSANALNEVGTKAVEVVRTRWPDLKEQEKWKFMRFRGKFDYDAARDFAISSLESRNPIVRRQAIEYLTQHKEALAMPTLLKMLNTELPAEHRWVLLNGLANTGGEEVVAALIALLAPNSWAAKGEGLIPPRGPTPDWWPDGRVKICEALGKLKASQATPALLTVLEEKGQGQAYLGFVIIPLLGEFGNTKAISSLRRVLITETKDLEPTSGSLRSVAVALWQLRDRSGWLQLVPLFQSKHDSERQFASEIVSRFGDTSDIWLLVRWLNDPDEEVRYRASRGLARITGIEIRTRFPDSTAEEADLWRLWYDSNKSKSVDGK